MGWTADEAENVRHRLLEAVLREDADFLGADDYGQRYALDFPVQGMGGAATVRSLWMIRPARIFHDLSRVMSFSYGAYVMNQEIRVLNVVALTEDVPNRGLQRGQVGTVVETLGSGVFEVEFVNNDGRTYATLPLKSSQLLVLHYQPT